MREILFRGKRKDNGEWVEGYYARKGVDKDTFKHFICVMTFNVNGNTYSSMFYLTDIEVIPETVGQYTGLKDVHGTRIFEGDVVKSIAAWYVVEFENGGYGLRPFGKGKLIPIMGHGNFNENEVEVIGNVFDNSLEELQNGMENGRKDKQ